jgi:hypothetical protein
MSNYALAGEVIDWIKEPYGECDRTRLFKVLNECRERFYLMYESIQLFDITMCFEVQTFCVDCNQCSDTYRGVTLPRDFQNVEAMWFGNQPVELYSSWREWQMGIEPECNCNLQKFDMPGSYASERDPLAHHPEPLRAAAVNQADVGKEVVVRYIDFAKVNRMQVLKLSPEGALTEFPAIALAQGAGFSKSRTAGPVTLGTASGRHLSIYGMDETVPSYRRVKITGLPRECSQVNIRGARKYFPVYRDTDVVETNNRVAFQEMARFIRINDKAAKIGDDIRTMTFHAGQAKVALGGEKSREVGKSVQSEVKIVGASFGPPRIGGW